MNPADLVGREVDWTPQTRAEKAHGAGVFGCVWIVRKVTSPGPGVRGGPSAFLVPHRDGSPVPGWWRWVPLDRLTLNDC